MTQGRSGSIQIGSEGPSGTSLNAKIDRDHARVVNHLIHLGRDLLGAYETAMKLLESDDLRAAFAVMVEGHKQQIASLADAVRVLGGEPAEHGDYRMLLEKGRVYVSQLAGDQGIVSAMADNEAVMFRAYEQERNHAGMPSEVREVLDRVAEQEARHRAFYRGLTSGT